MRDNGRDSDASDSVVDLSEICFYAYDRLYTPRRDVGRRWLRSRGLSDRDIVRHAPGFARRASDLSRCFRAYEPDAAGFVVTPIYDGRCDACPYALFCSGPSQGTAEHVKEWRPKGLESVIWRGWT
jgi:hypothetical protein